MRMIDTARRLAEPDHGALRWLDECSVAIGEILAEEEFIAPSHLTALYIGARNKGGHAAKPLRCKSNYTLEDMGLFASPQRALKLSTIHNAKGREFDAVAMIKLHERTIPFYLSKTEQSSRQPDGSFMWERQGQSGC